MVPLHVSLFDPPLAVDVLSDTPCRLLPTLHPVPWAGVVHRGGGRSEGGAGARPTLTSTHAQVTRHGEPVYLHSHDNLVIVGITATSPALLLPDIMILACSKDHAQGKEQALCAPHAACDLELTR